MPGLSVSPCAGVDLQRENTQKTKRSQEDDVGGDLYCMVCMLGWSADGTGVDVVTIDCTKRVEGTNHCRRTWFGRAICSKHLRCIEQCYRR